MKKYRIRKNDDPDTDRVVDATQLDAYCCESMGFAVIEEIDDEVITPEGVGQSTPVDPSAAGTETPPPQ